MPFAFDSLRRRDAPELFARMATYAFAVLAVSTIALAALAPPIVQMLLPESYRAATPLVPLLAAGLAVQSLAWFPMTSVNVAKRTRIYPIVTAIGAAVSVGANLLLIPPFGMRGAAYTLLVSQTIAAFATAWFAQKAYRIPCRAHASAEGHPRWRGHVRRSRRGGAGVAGLDRRHSRGTARAVPRRTARRALPRTARMGRTADRSRPAARPSRPVSRLSRGIHTAVDA